MKRKSIKTAVILICTGMLLAGCGNEAPTSNASNSMSDQPDSIAMEEESKTINSPADTTEGEIIMSTDVDIGWKSRFKGSDLFSKEYEDDNDEYNSKATPAEEFSYNELYLDPGTCCVTYNGDAESIVVPSRIDGLLVTELSGVGESVKNLTIPDTVSTITGGGSAVEEINYKGTLMCCESDIFSDSPYRETNTNDGAFVLGGALVKYTGEDEEYTVPEGIIAISDGAFSSGIAKKIVMPTTLKYIDGFDMRNFKDVESIELNSELERIYKVDLSDIETMPYVEHIHDNDILIFGNVLLRCMVDDSNYDVVIPENVTLAIYDCFGGYVNSIKFESKSDVRFHSGAFNRNFIVNKFIFPENTTNLMIGFSNLEVHEELVLPTNLKYLNGNIFSCGTFLWENRIELPNNLELYYSPTEGSLGYEYVNTALEQGTIVIQDSGEGYFGN